MIENLLQVPADFWRVLEEMAPYLLFGFLVAGMLSVFVPQTFVERHLGGQGIGPIVKAAAFGVPLPLCSCGVIPVAASIRRHGASKGATTAFLISTPQTGVDSILATFSLLGGVFAIYRPIAALISGALGGAIVSAVEKDSPADKVEKCNDACCSNGAKSGAIIRALGYGFVTLPRDIGKALLAGLAVAALISAVVPKGYFSTLVPAGPLQILVLMLVGVPVYICATASIPVAAKLILAGVSPGAAFALLMTGPATNAATVGTVWKVMGRRVCIIYLATMMVGAFIGGVVLDWIVTAQDVQSAMHHGWMPGWVKTVSAVALLVVLCAAVVGPYLRRARFTKENQQMAKQSVDLDVTGMTCSHCAESVRRALVECEGAETAEVDLAGGRARVYGQADPAELQQAVQGLGYDADLRGEEAPGPEEHDD